MLDQALSMRYSGWLYLKPRVMLDLEEAAIVDAIGITLHVLLLHLYICIHQAIG